MTDGKQTDVEKASVQESGPKTPPLKKEVKTEKPVKEVLKEKEKPVEKKPESNALGAPGSIVNDKVDHSDVAAVIAEAAAYTGISTIVVRDEETRSIAYEEIAKAPFQCAPSVRLNPNLGTRLTWRRS